MATTPFRGITVTTNAAGVKRFLYRYDALIAGKKQSRTRTFDTIEAARAYQIETEYQQQRGTYIEPSTRPFGELVAEWLDLYARRRKANSWLKRRAAWTNHGAPLLAAIPLRSITPADIQAAYDAATAKGRSASTVLCLHAVVRPALELAIKRRLIASNPATEVILPTVPRSTPAHYTTEEAHAFEAAIVGDPDEAFYTVLLRTGLRIGEVLALRWTDLDLEAALLTVARTLTWDKDAREVIGDSPKSATSGRTIALDPVTVAALRRHRAEQHARRLAMGASWRGSGLVFCADDGHRMASITWRDRLKALLAAPGTIRRGNARIVKPGCTGDEPSLPALTPHGLRHTTATIALDAGAHPLVVQELLGHANVGITTGTYMHVTTRLQRDLAAMIAAKLDTSVSATTSSETDAKTEAEAKHEAKRQNARGESRAG